MIAVDKKSCVIGSVEGVNMAERIVERKIMYRQACSICFTEIIFNKPKTI